MLLRFRAVIRAFSAITASAVLIFVATLSASAVTPSSGPANGGTSVTIDGVEFVQVSTTMTHTLALTDQGTVYAWGTNFGGALGDGTTTNRSLPVQVKGVGGVGYLTGVTSIAAGAWFSLAVTADGVVAWGFNGSGQLGDGTTTDRPTPVAVVGTNGSGSLTGVTKVAAGNYHSVALASSGVYAWGNNHRGQLGNGTNTLSSIPVQVKNSQGTGTLSAVTDIASGSNHTLAITTSGVMAWGFNSNGQLGTNNQTDAMLPVQVLGLGGTGLLTSVTSISAGESFSLASGSFGVYAWGDNSLGQLGNGTTNNSLVPTQVVGVGGSGTLQNVSSLGTGLYSSYAISSSSAYAWGKNSLGELGDNTTVIMRTSPVVVLGVGGSGNLPNVTSIDGGEFFAVAVSAGDVYAWGLNDEWFGNGSNTPSMTPTLSANFQPASISFGSTLGTNVTRSNNQWSVTSPTGSVGTVALTAIANVFGGITAANPSTYTWSAGSFTYTPSPSPQATSTPSASLVKSGAPDFAPVFIASALALLGGAGLLAARRRLNRF